MKRRSSTSVKKILHSGHTFSTRDSFPPGVLPTKRHVIERILHLKNFRTFNAANDIAREIYDRWVWCNVYPIHLYTISKKVQSFVNCFSALDRWSKKKRGEAFLQKEKEFMSTIDEIFDVFCADDKQRRILEKQHGLKMTDDDYAFYKDQTSKRVGKCVDAVVFFFFFFFFFYLYIYPPDSQESDGGAIHRVSNYPDLLPEMPIYCCQLVN